MIIPKWLKLLLVLFFPLYFFYLIASSAPAGWAAWGLSKAVPSLWLNDVNGSFWDGSAEFAQVDLGGDMLISLGELRWQLKPLALLGLRACIQIDANKPGQSISGQVCRGLTGATQLGDVSVDAPMSLINSLLPVRIDGRGSLQLMRADLVQSAVNPLFFESLNGKYAWQDARAFDGSTWMTLGSFGANLSAGEAGEIKAKIFDLAGPFKIDADADWQLKNGWQITGDITPSKQAPKRIIQGLQIIGDEKTPGTYHLVWP